MWKSQKIEREMAYDCDNCVLKGYNKKRICFKENPRHLISYPIFSYRGTTPVCVGYGERVCDVEDFYDILITISYFFPSRPLLEIWKSYFRGGDQGVCIESIITPYWDFWATIESDCKEYGWTPSQILDMRIDELFILRSVRGARNFYERIRYEEEMARLKSKDK